MKEKFNANSIKLWHGSQRWSGTPKLKPPRAGKYEHGPGIYMSNFLSCARKYSKGGGKIVLMEISSDISFLEDAYLSLDEQLEGLSHLPRVKSRESIKEDLKRADKRHNNQPMPACYLLNLCVNYESLSGQSGICLANWYAGKNIDASLTNPSTGGEDWLIVFNPEKIISSTPMSYDKAWEIHDFPRVKDQLEVFRKANKNNVKKVKL